MNDRGGWIERKTETEKSVLPAQIDDYIYIYRVFQKNRYHLVIE